MADEKIRIRLSDQFGALSDHLSANRRALLTYLAIFIPATAIASGLDASLGLGGGGSGTADSFGYYRDNGLIGLFVLIASVAAQCWLFGQMLGKADVSGRYLGFLGMAIVTFLGVGVATVFFVIPGLFLGARWLMAPAIYVDQGRGVFDALGESWHRTRGNTGTVMLALFLVMVMIVLASGALATLFPFAEGGGPLGYLAEAVVSEVFSIVLLTLSVATYGLLSGQGEELASVFD